MEQLESDLLDSKKYGAVEMHGTLGYQHWHDTSAKFHSSL